MVTLKTTVNGTPRVITTWAQRRLLDLLREDLGLTGAKEGCGIGECGACTVVVNGLAVNSCLVLAGQLQGADIVTVEGLAANGGLHRLQKSFLAHGAVQCGFCTPGMLMPAWALLQKNPHPGEEEIRTALAGNLCRCTGYKQIMEAVREAADAAEEPRGSLTPTAGTPACRPAVRQGTHRSSAFSWRWVPPGGGTRPTTF